jgi:hypothetical protein
MQLSTGRTKLTLAVVLLAGCSFPDVTFGGAPASGGNGAGAAAGAAPPTGGSGNGGSDGGTAPIGGAEACDRDHDDALRDVAGCCATDCDCDDNDPNVFPGQTAFFVDKREGFELPTEDGAFDYNCDGDDEREFQQGNCGSLGQCEGGSPPTFQVFTPGAGGYECGTAGVRRYCAGGCQQDDSYTLGCR